MRTITKIVVHCSATPPSRDVGVREISAMHKDRGFKEVDGTYCGYHWVIRRDGRIEHGRKESSVGAHVQGHNANSIGICLAGGIDAAGRSENNFTEAQFAALRQLLGEVIDRYPKAELFGHRDLSPDKDGDGVVERHEWLKDCPCFDVRAWWSAEQRPSAPTDVALAGVAPKPIALDPSGQVGEGARYGVSSVAGAGPCFAWFTVKAEAIGYAQLRGAHVRDLVEQKAVWAPPA